MSRQQDEQGVVLTAYTSNTEAVLRAKEEQTEFLGARWGIAWTHSFITQSSVHYLWQLYPRAVSQTQWGGRHIRARHRAA